MKYKLVKVLQQGKAVNLCLYQEPSGREVKGLSAADGNSPILIGEDAYVERMFLEVNGE
ncbi:MAG: hypothetical protein PHV18_04045 [Lachnospiraceae bacterium]|nr:hypothetical protein [Lachnospiraceae bacterium]